MLESEWRIQTANLKTDRSAQGMSGAKAGGAEGEGEINEWVRRAGGGRDPSAQAIWDLNSKGFRWFLLEVVNFLK